MRAKKRSRLAKSHGLETLEAAYGAWLEQKLEHAERSAAMASELRRLQEQGRFMMGTVRAAGVTGAPAAGGALARRGELDSFLHQAQARLTSAREELERRLREEQAAYEKAEARLCQRIRARVERHLQKVRPRLLLLLRPVLPERRILHLERVSGDEAVLLLYLFTGKIPSRYGFLFDDSTDDPSLPPPPLYPELGVASQAVRPSPGALAELLSGPATVVPLKGFLPLRVGKAFYRLLQRGPVMEVEIQDADGFRNLLSPQEAEALGGHLLQLKLEGKIELEIRPG